MDDYPHWDYRPLPADVFKAKREQVVRFIETGSPQPAEIFIGVPSRHAEEITQASFERPASNDLCKRFLRGNTAPWLGFVAANATIKRTIEKTLLRGTQHRAVLITSAAGDGKSTLMYRLAKQLFDEDWRVLFKHPDRQDTRLTWPLGRSERANTVLFLDRAEGIVDLPALSQWLDENPKLRVVLAAREMDWQQREFALEGSGIEHFPLGRLDDDEINALAELLIAYEAPNTKVSFDVLRDRLRRSVHETEYPHMLAAVMTACSGESFAQTLTSMVDNFKPQELLRWTALCAVSSDAHGLPTLCTGRIMAALHCEGLEEDMELRQGEIRICIQESEKRDHSSLRRSVRSPAP